MAKKKINILMLLMNESIGGTATYLFTLMRYMEPTRFDLSIVCNNEEFCRLAEHKGFKTFHLEKAGRGRYLKAILCVTRIIRENSVDILNIHDGGAVSLIGRLAALITSTICVSTVHIYAGDWGNREKWFVIKELFFEKVTRGLAKKFIAVSHARKSELIRRGTRQKDIVVIQNGIDYESFVSCKNVGQLRHELGVDQTTPIVAVIAHLGVEKGHFVFLEAAQILVNLHSDIIFVIVGDGYLKEALVKRVQQLEIENAVVFTGFRDDIPAIINSINILVLPSFNEGLPMVILEAMAASKPVISTLVGGIPEVVIDNETGILVEPGNSKQLAEAIDKLLNDPQQAKIFGDAGYERVKQSFSAQRMAEETQYFYEGLI